MRDSPGLDARDTVPEGVAGLTLLLWFEGLKALANIDWKVLNESWLSIDDEPIRQESARGALQTADAVLLDLLEPNTEEAEIRRRAIELFDFFFRKGEGWFVAVIPVSVIERERIPLPIFLALYSKFGVESGSTSSEIDTVKQVVKGSSVFLDGHPLVPA